MFWLVQRRVSALQRVLENKQNKTQCGGANGMDSRFSMLSFDIRFLLARKRSFTVFNLTIKLFLSLFQCACMCRQLCGIYNDHLKNGDDVVLVMLYLSSPPCLPSSYLFNDVSCHSTSGCEFITRKNKKTLLWHFYH